MVTHEQKRRLGVFVFISLLALIVTLALLLGPKLQDKGDEYLVRFRGLSVNGLNVGGSVKYQGVEIGRVTEISVDPDDINAILVRIKVRKLFPMKDNMEVKLQFLGITGIRYLEISGGTNAAPRIKKGSELPIGRGLGEQAEDVVSNVDEAVKNITHLLRTENLEKVSRILTNLEKSTQQLNNAIGERIEGVKTTLSDLAEISANLKLTAQNLNSISSVLQEGMRGISWPDLFNKADSVVSNLQRRLSDQELGLAVSRLNRLLDSADKTMKNIGDLFGSQQDGVSDTLRSFREAIENFSQLTRDLSEDPSSLIKPRKEARRKK